MRPRKELLNYSNYKDFLKDITAQRGVQSEMARAIGCQAAYLYQVLKGKAELTEDQAYKVTVFLNLDSLSRDYFLLMVRLSKAASIELKKFLREELESRKAEFLNLKSRSDSQSPISNDEIWSYYFSSALPSAIHLLTSSENCQEANSIAKKLDIPVKVANFHLSQLEKFNLVKHKNNKWFFSGESLHFPKKSKFNTNMQILRRSQSLTSLLKDKEDDVHYSNLFTLDKSSLAKLRLHIADFVEQSQKTIHAGGTEELYVLSVDLFAPY